MTLESPHSTAARPFVCFHLRRRCTPTTCHAHLGMLLMQKMWECQHSEITCFTFLKQQKTSGYLKFAVLLVLKITNVNTSVWTFLRYGGLVVLLQTSPESANIFVLLQRIFRKQTPAQLEQVATAAGLSSEEYQVHGLAVSLPFHFFLKQAFIHKRLQPYKNVSSMFSRLWYSGLSGVCSRSVCKHGQLQVFWRHKVHPKSA